MRYLLTLDRTQPGGSPMKERVGLVGVLLVAAIIGLGGGIAYADQ